MSLLNTILGAAGGLMGQQNSNPLLNVVVGLLSNQQGGGGGLAGLIGQFQKAGLGNAMQSWIGTGANMPVSGEQIQQALGNEQIAAIASQLGISPNEASGQLAQLLPDVIDKLTPDGQAPSAGFGSPDQILGLLGNLMKR